MSDDLKHTCASCGGHITYPADAIGQTVQCPHCEQAITLGESPVTEGTPDLAGQGQSAKRGMKMGLLVGVGVLVLASVVAGIWMVATRKGKGDGETAQQSGGASAAVKPSPTTPTPVASGSVAPTPTTPKATEPKTLEEALLNFSWEWTHAPKPPDKLRFQKDGTASSPRFSWRWKITGPNTALAFDGKGWTAELVFDATFNSLKGQTRDGKYHYTAVRMSPENPTSTDSLAASPVPSAPAISVPTASATAKSFTAKGTDGIPRVSTPGSPWPGQYKLRPENKLTAADVVGPDGVVYPDWRYAGVRGGIPDVPVVAKIEDFGGKVDDNQDDSVALIKAAESVGRKGGGAILLGAGTYHLDRPVVITEHGVVIRGAGKDKTKLLFRYQPPVNGVTLFRPRPDDLLHPGSWLEVHGRPQGLASLRLEVDGQFVQQRTNFQAAYGQFSMQVRGKALWDKVQNKDGPHEIKATATYRTGQRGETKMTANFGWPSELQPYLGPGYNGMGAITFMGSGWAGPELKLRKEGHRGDMQIELVSTEGLSVGDSFRLDVPHSESWQKLIQSAYVNGTASFRRYDFVIEKLEGNTVTLNQPLRLDFPLAEGAQVHRTLPVRRCGVESLEIQQSFELCVSGVMIQAGQECWVREVSIKKAGRFPVFIEGSKWCEIRDCVFDDAWYQGGGGTAYVGLDSSCDCLMDSIVASRLRHAPICSWGASGNVFRRFKVTGSDGHWHAGWTSENLFENCEINGQPYKGAYGYGLWASPPEDKEHGPNGPRNVVYGCNIKSPKSGLWMGGMNEGWLILYNKFDVGSGPGVFAKTSSFDHIIKGNVFRLADATKPAIWHDDASCVGIEFTDNLVVGGNGQISGGVGKLAVERGNTLRPLANVQSPQPAVPSIFEWQRSQKK